MNVVMCWHCMHVFGQDEDSAAASEIAKRTSQKYQKCPGCQKPLELNIAWSSGPMDNRPADVQIEVDLDSGNVPDPAQLLRDNLAKAGLTAKPKKKSWWRF